MNKDPQNFTASQWLEEKRKYKEALQRSVQTQWGPEVRIGGKADYYIYFYLHGLALLRQHGTFCFITSNSWLDVGYGADLQQFLLTHTEVKDIYDNHAKRSFASSDVNTVIVLFRRPSDDTDLSTHAARFVAFKRPFEEVLTADNLTLIEWANTIQRTDELRVYPLSQNTLWHTGLDSADGATKTMALGFGYGRYGGDKWGGKYLRAPDLFFTILEKGQGKLIRLGDIAKVRRGFTTGANSFFYVKPSVARQWGIEEEFLRYVVKTPRDYYSIAIREVSSLSLFYCDKPKSQLKGTNALRYIQWGERQGFHRRPSCRSREFWYALPVQQTATMLWPAALFERYICYIPPKDTLADKLFYVISGDLSPLTQVFLNSAIIALFVEIFGYQLNHGGIFITVDQLSDFPVLQGECTEALSRSFKAVSSRDVDLFSRERNHLDRRRLDTQILDALGIPTSELETLYDILQQSIADRIHKARRELTKESRRKYLAKAESTLSNEDLGVVQLESDSGN